MLQTTRILCSAHLLMNISHTYSKLVQSCLNCAESHTELEEGFFSAKVLVAIFCGRPTIIYKLCRQPRELKTREERQVIFISLCDIGDATFLVQF